MNFATSRAGRPPFFATHFFSVSVLPASSENDAPVGAITVNVGASSVELRASSME